MSVEQKGRKGKKEAMGRRRRHRGKSVASSSLVPAQNHSTYDNFGPITSLMPAQNHSNRGNFGSSTSGVPERNCRYRGSAVDDTEEHIHVHVPVLIHDIHRIRPDGRVNPTPDFQVIEPVVPWLPTIILKLEGIFFFLCLSNNSCEQQTFTHDILVKKIFYFFRHRVK